MVMQEGAPSLGGRPGALDHVLRDARLSDFKAEFEQLAMDTRGAPQWIVNAHPPDQRAQVRVDLRSASKGAGVPPPISPEAGPVPAHQGLRPDDRDGLEDRYLPATWAFRILKPNMLRSSWRTHRRERRSSSCDTVI